MEQMATQLARRPNMTTRYSRKTVLLLLACAVGAAAVVALTVGLHGTAQLLKGAFTNADAKSTDAKNLSGVMQVITQVEGPVTVVTVALSPLACTVGAGLVLMGSRRGMSIIGTALGVLIFVGSLNGIIA
jgi:hypothetical protein